MSRNLFPDVFVVGEIVGLAIRFHTYTISQIAVEVLLTGCLMMGVFCSFPTEHEQKITSEWQLPPSVAGPAGDN